MHSDLAGAASVVVKNPKGTEIPPITLNEAGQFTICHSHAWDSKILDRVYWVNADQVSKTAPTGLYIKTGSFMIYGKRNYLTPSKLEVIFSLNFVARIHSYVLLR